MTKKMLILLLPFMAVACSSPVKESLPATVTLSSDILQDKIKGGWAGQVIGCTYGGPTEFHFCGSMINDYHPVPWEPHGIRWWYENAPGLYDDVYMDLTFVQVFDRLGLDAPADSHAMAFATAGYPLWHANQSARYNILNGIMPPASGHWKNNPHADDIDFQIEADFAGLMSPGMPNAAATICDKTGHIMNYGDGWYGGVYVAAMYSLAFVTSNIETIVTEALKTIPPQSKFYQCIHDVIEQYHKDSCDWKMAWFICQKKWADDRGCPDGVFSAFNIDASINAAYIVIGLLYGHGDYEKTIDIATRCGQDSDCNPASAGGILGTILGYSNIPEKFLAPLREVEDMDFKYTTVSLNDVYAMSFKHALQMIEKNGGKREGNNITIPVQQPMAVRYEKSFEGLEPVKMISMHGGKLEKNLSCDTSFAGAGIVIKGYVKGKDDYIARVHVVIDDSITETVNMPASRHSRRNEIYWNYNLTQGNHRLSVKWLNPEKEAEVFITGCLIYEKR